MKFIVQSKIDKSDMLISCGRHIEVTEKFKASELVLAVMGTM